MVSCQARGWWMIVAVALIGCYRPELEDCAVRCEGNDDRACAPGQRCTEGWCTAQGATCPDVDPPALLVEIRLRGKVVVRDVAECVNNRPNASDPVERCTYPSTPPGTTFVLTAEKIPGGLAFTRWGDNSQCDEIDGNRCTIEVSTEDKEAVARFGD